MDNFLIKNTLTASLDPDYLIAFRMKTFKNMDAVVLHVMLTHL